MACGQKIFRALRTWVPERRHGRRPEGSDPAVPQRHRTTRRAAGAPIVPRVAAPSARLRVSSGSNDGNVYYFIGFVNLCVSIKGVAQLCDDSDGGVPALLCASDHSVPITSAPTIGVTLERANDGNGSRRRAASDSTSASLPMRPGETPRRTARGAVGARDTTTPTQRFHVRQRRPARPLVSR